MILHRIFGGEASLKIPVWEIKMRVDDFVGDVGYTECGDIVMKDTGSVRVLPSRFASAV